MRIRKTWLEEDLPKTSTIDTILANGAVTTGENSPALFLSFNLD